MSEPRPIQYFRIKNFETYQHRDHKKSMPWIRLWCHILEDETFNQLDHEAQLLYFKLLILAARTGNRMVHLHTYVGGRVGHRRCALSLKKLEEFQLIEVFSAHDERAIQDKIREDKIYKEKIFDQKAFEKKQRQLVQIVKESKAGASFGLPTGPLAPLGKDQLDEMD